MITSPEKQNKDQIRRFYDSINKQLNSTIYGEYSYFLNLGYVANGNPEFSPIKLPAHCLNRNSVKLILELIGDCNPVDCEVLDIGCGRGGSIYVIDQYFSVKRLVGLDLSLAAIGFCNRSLSSGRRFFVQGNAEQLPFPEESFDIVINVESSGCYPNINAFYGEVCRALKGGGYFLYADLFPAEDVDPKLNLLQSKGLIIERNQDITSNVLLSCDEVADRKMTTFNRAGGGGLADFLAAPGSESYQAMSEGQLVYKIFRLRKPGQSGL